MITIVLVGFGWFFFHLIPFIATIFLAHFKGRSKVEGAALGLFGIFGLFVEALVVMICGPFVPTPRAGAGAQQAYGVPQWPGRYGAPQPQPVTVPYPGQVPAYAATAPPIVPQPPLAQPVA